MCSLIASTVASVLRRRNTATLKVEGHESGIDEEGDELLQGTRKSAGATQSYTFTDRYGVLRVLGVVLVAAGLLSYFLMHGEQEVQSCEGPTVADRLAQAQKLHGFNHDIFTPSAETQHLFNLGLIQSWNFNQFEAEAAFMAALELDPVCSRCWWGVAYALGPGANRAALSAPTAYPSFSPADFPETQEAALKALSLAEIALSGNPSDMAAQRDLEWGQAMAVRFRNGSALGEGRDAAEEAHARAVAAMGRKYNNADMLAMAAESFMNLHPWDYYTENEGLRPTAAEAEGLIKQALQLDPSHPLAIHLYIHIAEASSPLQSANMTAHRAEAFAEVLLSKPGPWQGMGHLRHMPSHIFQRIGRYHDGVVSNQQAFEADKLDSDNCRVPYGADHNTDMLINNALMGGEASVALQWSERLRSFPSLLPTVTGGDDSIDWTHLPLVQATFGMWDDILSTPAPPPTARGNCATPTAIFYARAVWHFVRVLAGCARAQRAMDQGLESEAGIRAQVAEDYISFKGASSGVQEEEGTHPGLGLGIYACHSRNLLRIYDLTAQARVALLDKELSQSQGFLERALAVEDSLQYMEPPQLYQPVRHCLGYVMLLKGDPAAAEKVFSDDLQKNPDNGRALYGLAESLIAQGRIKEGNEIKRNLSAGPWLHADEPLSSSCHQFGSS